MVLLDQAGDGADRLRIVPERGPLSAFVEHYWVEDMSAGAARDLGSWRIVPDTCGHVLFHIFRDACGGQRHGGLRLVGARSTFVDIDKRRRLLTLGARLRPGALGALMSSPAVEITDRSVALEDVIGASVSGIAQRLYDEHRSCPEVALGVLRTMLAPLLLSPRDNIMQPRTAAIIGVLERHRGRITATAVADEVGVSPRTLRQLMRERVGIGAKRFARICRVHHIIRGAAAGGRSWVEMALDAGYADQPHLIRDFDALLGETPPRFLARRGDAA